jgi:hypothetical protein
LSTSTSDHMNTIFDKRRCECLSRSFCR